MNRLRKYKRIKIQYMLENIREAKYPIYNILQLLYRLREVYRNNNFTREKEKVTSFVNDSKIVHINYQCEKKIYIYVSKCNKK